MHFWANDIAATATVTVIVTVVIEVTEVIAVTKAEFFKIREDYSLLCKAMTSA